jgi:hypothetical protein
VPLDGASCHGPLQERWLTVAGSRDDDARTMSKGGEAQATKSVKDVLETPKIDGSTEGRNIVWQTLTVGSGDERQ